MMHRLVKLALMKLYADSHVQISRRAKATPRVRFSRNYKPQFGLLHAAAPVAFR
jgi:hypothetical protein